MSQPLVQPIFSTGPKDQLAAADIYKVDSKKVITSIQEISSKAGLDVKTLLSGIQNAEVGKLLSVTKAGITVDKDALALRLVTSSKSITSSFRDLSKDAKEKVMSSFEDFGEVGVKINGIVQYVKDADIPGLNAVGKFVNDYVKSPLYEIVDEDAVAGLVSGIAREAYSLGLNGLLPQLTNGMSGRILNRVLKNSFPDMIKNSDLTSLSTFANGQLGKSLDFIYPNFAQDLAGAFGYKKLTDIFDQNVDYHAVLGILSAANSNWDVHVHKNGYVPGNEITGMSIVKLQKSSQAFKDIILRGIKSESDFDRRKNYALILHYGNQTTVEAEIARFFPAVGIRARMANAYNPPVKKKTADPRLLAKIGEKLLVNLANNL